MSQLPSYYGVHSLRSASTLRKFLFKTYSFCSIGIIMCFTTSSNSLIIFVIWLNCTKGVAQTHVYKIINSSGDGNIGVVFLVNTIVTIHGSYIIFSIHCAPICILLFFN
jgi:hypothetical protein